MATETLTHVADGFTGHTSQDWTRSPLDGTWNSKINTDEDLKQLQAIGFQADHGSGVDDWIESNFIMSDPVAGDIRAVTSIIWGISYLAILITALWVTLQAELRQASTGNLIATTDKITLAADGTWKRGEAFPFGGLDVDLTAVEAKDLAVKWKGSSSNGVFGSAAIALDILEPTITYSPLPNKHHVMAMVGAGDVLCRAESGDVVASVEGGHVKCSASDGHVMCRVIKGDVKHG